uniref:Trissin n=1 Tax=Heliothis virescens TaxID=7102 RepID=A0A2A4KA10_HELVI
MLKIIALICVVFCVSSAWAGCDSCGQECAPACGTRRFRACCFNYLRRKRGPELNKILTAPQDMKEETGAAMFVVANIPVPEPWMTNVLSSENQRYSLEDMVENRLN